MMQMLSQPLVLVYPEAVRRNWQRFVAMQSTAPAGYVSPSGWPGIMAVIKADAYGHGILPIAKCLFAAGAGAFGVGSVAEGAELVRHMPELRNPSSGGSGGVRILPLLGIRDAEEADHCLAAGLVPFIHRPGQATMLAARYAAQGGTGPLHIALKVDTGLCRLGFAPEDLPALFEELAACPSLLPSLLLSHFASADVPDQGAACGMQSEHFRDCLAAFRSRWPDITPSITNSPGTLDAAAHIAGLGPSMARPGVSLYGVNPFAGTDWASKGEGFLPAMEVVTPVLQVKDIPAGARISYAHTYTAPRPMRIAVLAAGYADGMSRGLSSNGSVCIRGMRAPRLGRVCMQMHMVDVTHIPDCVPGDAAYILGGSGSGISVQEIADLWGTIPHEVLCILGKNPQRVMDGLAS